MNYQPTIGLEIHVELKTRTKMFCSCQNNPDEKQANVDICPVCTAQPGSLPTINLEAVRKVIKTGLALNCQIPQHSKFDRKNYFYPDLPKGYQISQYDMPIARQGELKLKVENEKFKTIRIQRVHLEEDTGRLIHSENKDYSLVDFNRAGVPLMELVTEPDIACTKEARRFSQELQLILRYLDVSSADMEKGQMRVEVNISLSEEEDLSSLSGKDQKLGTKVEIKNLNSFRSVERSIEYEIERQRKILESGKKVIQETRGWNDAKEITVSQREKEEAHDYRYFSEPDLPPLRHSEKFIEEVRGEIPELPQQRRERFEKEYGLDLKSIEIFVQNKSLGEYFEKAMSELRNWIKVEDRKSRVSPEEFFKLAKLCQNYIISDLQGLLKGGSLANQDFLITPENFAEFVALIYKEQISSRIAKQVLEEMFKTGADPSHIIEEKGLVQISDEVEIKKIVKEVVSQNEKAVEDFRKGKNNSFQYLIGQIMAKTKGKANPQVVRDILTKELDK
ncbi:MAG: Asp-tRNA(Asn)/Glu-tRNA(Gln) amidotransferase subunit GatB [bacterium]